MLGQLKTRLSKTSDLLLMHTIYRQRYEYHWNLLKLPDEISAL